ncbi:MAG: hypothetical protein G01um101493_77 [Microgenomates group bacterium Gr01-1014_93]|nr:MAG: hypothetical protein G01um101493_77 [Microgenomates group bacterium Gr01-1014_93]
MSEGEIYRESRDVYPHPKRGLFIEDESRLTDVVRSLNQLNNPEVGTFRYHLMREAVLVSAELYEQATKLLDEHGIPYHEVSVVRRNDRKIV